MARRRSGPGTRTAAQEAVRTVSNETVRQLATVRALWFAVQMDPDWSLKDLSREFYGAVGDVLEGKTLDQIELHRIDPKRVAPFLKKG